MAAIDHTAASLPRRIRLPSYLSKSLFDRLLAWLRGAPRGIGEDRRTPLEKPFPFLGD
ncbi:MAG: hypothetical protein ACLQIQ_18535 [Beijerinckiaceae bacterium]